MEVRLTKGYTTQIDDVDADLARFKWQVFVLGTWAYAVRGTPKNGKQPSGRLHRLILGRILGRDLLGSEYVDHIDGDPLNNRRSNLRVCTLAQNSHNAKRRKDNTSGYKGVYFDKSKKKWRAHIKLNNKRKMLGMFKTAEEAYERYCAAAKELFGEFANFGN